MNILILANKMPYPPKDGGAIATFSLLSALQRNGANIDVLAMNTPYHYVKKEELPAEISPNIRLFAVEVDTKIRLGKLIQNFFFSSQPYNAQRFISTAFENKLKELLQNNHYDIVQLEGLYLCPYISTIRACCQAKIAFRSHNIESEIWCRSAQVEKNILKKIYKINLSERIDKFERHYLNLYDFLLPITPRDARKYQQMGIRIPMQIVPTGIETDSPLFSIDNQKINHSSLFYIGALDWQPNIEGLYWFVKKVWLKFKKQYPQAVFTIAGRNASKPFADFLRKNQINYIGEIDKAIDIYAHHSIQIVPVLSGSGMRIKIIEGLAAGKAILTTSIGTEGINTEHERNILIADRAEDFYKCLEYLYLQKDIFSQLSENARLFVRKNFDNNVIARNVLTFYSRQI
ncbi:MAG: glycosyltransferase family 4 protein [Bacteroidales bacterium]|nr:glycosyltransferase family 4 protein [Bacteroidales bacterium]